MRLCFAAVLALPCLAGCGSGSENPSGGSAGSSSQSAGGSGGSSAAGASSTSGGAAQAGSAGSSGSIGASGAAGSGGSLGSGGSAGSAAAGASGSSASGGSSSGSGTCSNGSVIALYTDGETALHFGWAGHGTFAEQTSGGCEGSHFYQYDYSVQSYWDGFTLDLTQTVDASAATGLSFAYKQGPNDPNFFFIRLHTGATACAAGCDVEYHATVADWTVATIPISKFVDSGEVDVSGVTGVEFGFSGPDATGTLLIDNIVFNK